MTLTGREMTDDSTATLMGDVGEGIRAIVAAYGGLSVDIEKVADRDDLFRAGMTSQANVTVMLALEESYNIEFPEEMLRRSTFESLQAIQGAVSTLLCEQEAI